MDRRFLAQSEPGSPVYNAIAVRLGEKMIVEKALQRAKEQLEVVKKLWPQRTIDLPDDVVIQ
jgi:hypothetical protein